ncbi:hypothetical protein C8P66_101299 [Humitalea rosea]|uniref:Uncharacterized protein n=1 Tax=Humitalea rosea TaxID=990373 RepID=A0A2W7ITF7_9PROT|nr:hypothetical protein [Humitalea rosea]PZW51081.1 hypothetical protein C8P66_101299 [Humitalea rosea]
MIQATVPAGSRFKGYQSFVVQELVLRAHVLRLRRERWLTPEGQSITAPLPAGVVGHFGPELRRFVLAQYHQGQVTVARLLIAGQDGFITEARDVLWAGLETAPWISVDDTGARHAGANGVCTQIGNQDFTWFGTTTSKSRLNFLGLLRAGHPGSLSAPHLWRCVSLPHVMDAVGHAGTHSRECTAPRRGPRLCLRQDPRPG